MIIISGSEEKCHQSCGGQSKWLLIWGAHLRKGFAGLPACEMEMMEEKEELDQKPVEPDSASMWSVLMLKGCRNKIWICNRERYILSLLILCQLLLTLYWLLVTHFWLLLTLYQLLPTSTDSLPTSSNFYWLSTNFLQLLLTLYWLLLTL